MILLKMLICCFVLALTLASVAVQLDNDEDLRGFVKTLDKMHQVTKRRYLMDPKTAFDCRIPPKERDMDLHVNYYCEVYTNAKGKDVIESGEGDYPVGSVIIKAKFAGHDAKQAELYTIMRKMKKGYDEKHDDWEYAVVNGKGNRVLAQGKIESCIACHKNYASTDYVTREYMNDSLFRK